MPETVRKRVIRGSAQTPLIYAPSAAGHHFSTLTMFETSSVHALIRRSGVARVMRDRIPQADVPRASFDLSLVGNDARVTDDVRPIASCSPVSTSTPSGAFEREAGNRRIR